MQLFRKHSYYFFALLILLLLSGCFGKVDKLVTNYYVLDYQKSSEDQSLVRPKNTGAVLEVLDTYLPRTYDRNQIVVKENFYRVRYLQTDVWAAKLRDTIPNLVSERLRAYNIFSHISRGEQADKIPSYYLQTNVMNIEKLAGIEPKAYLRMEFVLLDSTAQNIVLSYQNERYTDLVDPSMVSLVQAYNDMIMAETNVFAAKCNMFFSGIPIPVTPPSVTSSYIERYYYEQIANSAAQITYGELLVQTKTATDQPIAYTIEALDSLNTVITYDEWQMNREVALRPGRYRITLGDMDELVIPVEIKARQRCVVNPIWSELKVVIIDASQNRVRSGYNIWVRDTEEGIGYKQYSGTVFSVGDDEVGTTDKLWILAPNSYLVKLGGGSWNDLRNFATVTLAKGDRKTLTIVVDPNSDTNYFVGAGVFADDDLGYGSQLLHKGAVHGNISLASNNNVEKGKPTNSLNLSAQFDNSVDTHEMIKPFHFTLRSLYDLGMNLSTGSDFHFNPDDYSLKGVILLYPWEKKPLLKNFAFYGRSDLNTHFFEETTNFPEEKDLILLDEEGVEIERMLGVSSLKTKKPLFPLKLKEGTGITYRIYFGSNSWLSLRGGYGLQQDYNQDSFRYKTTDNLTGFEYYQKDADRSTRGIESTVILSAANILKFISINSTLDVLFPLNVHDQDYHWENENRINLRIYRNISLDIKLNVTYDKQIKPWVVYDTSSFLRLSLYY